MRVYFCLLILAFLLFFSCKKEDPPVGAPFYCTEIKIGSKTLNQNNPVLNGEVPTDQPLLLRFNRAVDLGSVAGGVSLSGDGVPTPLTFSLQDGEQTVVAVPVSGALDFRKKYVLQITSSLQSKEGRESSPLTVQFETKAGALRIDSIIVQGRNLLAPTPLRDVPLQFTARVHFNQPINTASVTSAAVKLFRPGAFADVQFSFERQDSTLVVVSQQPLRHFEKYSLYLSAAITAPGGYALSDFSRSFFTALDPAPKFPVISDDALLDLVQERTFRYFWDFAHPVSGLARERNTSGDIVTIGGSGFGLMAMVVGVERGFITRQEAVARWQKIVGFLKNNAQRYHGAWSHWLNGSTGSTVPFSQKDNGADLVETSFLIQGLLTVRQYLDAGDPTEQQLIAEINDLWEGVEWDWFTRGGQDVLYWHWSPTFAWQMNHQIRGYNECLITYFLAASSPTHPVTTGVYHKGWANSGSIRNNNTYYTYRLPLGYSLGGPLFFAHYSYLGLDPRNLNDSYANYWEQNRHHTLINRAYCIANPLNKLGYSASCWGLTASDNHLGYNAHAPTNDLGVIAPTAALSSFPYTPQESMEALKFFYYQLGDKLWGPYGFYDAFAPSEGWYANSYLAIDQGPIVVMLENHRSGKLWNLFMSAPEVAVGAERLGFTF